jgi:outer membrane protein assembly factor BamB
MKRKWLDIIIIITILLLIGSVATSVVIPSTKNHEINEDILYSIKRDYFNDWYINNNYSDEYGCGGDDFNKGKCEDNISGDIWNNQITSDIVSGPMDSAWSMRGHDVNHTCRSPYSTVNNTGVEIWRVSGDDEGEVESSAVIDSDGIIYFGTMGSDHSLYALYPNGTRKWKYLADDIIWCTPAIADDGTIYIETWGGYLHALNPDGTKKWSFTPWALLKSSPSIGDDGTIYFGCHNNNIYAVNPNGTEKWRYLTSDIVMGSPAIGQDGTIYIGSGDYYLYALYPNGTLRWRFNTGSKIKGDASIGEDGTIYVPAFNSYFYALYPDGTLKWKGYTGSSVAGAGVALAEDGTIYIGTELLRAFYPNGTLKWSTNLQGDIYGTVPAVSADGTIYVSAGLDLVAVNPDGTERWRHTIADTGAYSSPSIDADGIVYVGSYWGGAWSYGYLHAFGNGPLHAEAGGPYSGLASHTPVQFNGLAFGGFPPYIYQWDFGDGNISNEQNPNYLYRDMGTYNITFMVTDDEGNMSTDTTTATVTYGPPLVSYLKPESAIYLANLKLFPFQYPLVFGRITIEVDVTHPFLPIDRVEFYKWDQLQMTDTTPPYTWTWSERIPLRGTHKIGITIKAYTSETSGYGFMEITKYF